MLNLWQIVDIILGLSNRNCLIYISHKVIYISLKSDFPPIYFVFQILDSLFSLITLLLKLVYRRLYE